MFSRLCILVLFIVFLGCTNTIGIKNEQKGKLTATYYLAESEVKRILLDYETAPKPPYMQMVEDNDGKRILTFFNPHKYSIYAYDYDNGNLLRTIEYEKEGPDGILRLEGYYIKTMDSIYVHSYPMVELILTDSLGNVKKKISLRENRTDREWYLYRPQYFFSTVNPIIELNNKLILTGIKPFSIADSLIDVFRFTSCVDWGLNNVEFFNTYPKKLYGSDVNWQDPMYMQPYTAISPLGERVFSFPVSHNIYITNDDAESYRTVYGGSNVAETISSIDDGRARTPNEVIHAHILGQDLYASILYDPYRHIYYRFMLKGIPGATTENFYGEKPIVVIMMDEQFNYLGETLIGNVEQWNWENTFVTREGLNIEYISVDEHDEDYMTLKIFTVEEIDR
ncbi:MAG: DUF4221 domain-containing protein [Bacteroidales bacterium]|jgi:hypothetical protein|nr:DUF4221 domain-containing protein [Bacteroidales bacterium]